jgi:hypothetical protein
MPLFRHMVHRQLESFVQLHNEHGTPRPPGTFPTRRQRLLAFFETRQATALLHLCDRLKACQALTSTRQVHFSDSTSLTVVAQVLITKSLTYWVTNSKANEKHL